MKLQKKIVLIAALTAVILFALLLTTAGLRTRKTTIGFYGLEPEQVTAFEQTFSALKNNKGKQITFKYCSLDSAQPIEGQLKNNKNIDLLITVNGAEALKQTKKIAEKHTGFDASLCKAMTSSLQNAAVTAADGKISMLPILCDHYEIAIDRNILAKTGMKTIASWKDITEFAKSAKKIIKYPIIFAGNDTDFFLSFLGALTESLNGSEGYEKTVAMINKSEPDLQKGISSLTSESTDPLYSAVSVLSDWYKQGLFSPDALTMTKNEVSSFMDANRAAIVFMPLSQHRTIKQTTIERYSSIYYPSSIPATDRRFTAPLLCALPLRSTQTIQSVVKQLISPEIQEKLSRTTGLAPVLAHSRTPDHQADDVRFWIAATNNPFAGLARDINIDQNTRSSIAISLQGLIKTRK